VSLFKRGNVWWSYVFVDGVRHSKSTGTNNRRTAEQIDHQHKEELNLRRHQAVQAQPEMPFELLAARFLAACESKPYYTDRLNQLLPKLSGTPIGRINKSTVLSYRLHRHTEKTISDATINRDLTCLRHILYWAVDEGFLTNNPLTRMKLARERKQHRPILSLTEEQQLMEAASPHLKRIITAALDSGMRRGELLHQRWEDIDLTRRILSVSHSKTPEGEAREIPLTDRLFRMFQKEPAKQGIVFTFKGQPIQIIKTTWKTTLRNAGIRHFRFHDLRHTFNTRLMEAGVMPDVRKALMGHSSGEDVHSIYTHVELPMKREAIQKLEAWRTKQLQEIESQSQPKGGVLIPWKKSSTS